MVIISYITGQQYNELNFELNHLIIHLSVRIIITGIGFNF